MNTGLLIAALLAAAALIDFMLSYRRAHVLMVLQLEWDREDSAPLVSTTQLLIKQQDCLDNAILERLAHDYVLPPNRFTIVMKLRLTYREAKIWRNAARDVALNKQADPDAHS